MRKFVTRDVIPIVQGTFWLNIKDPDIIRILISLGQKRIKYMNREERTILEDLLGDIKEDPSALDFDRSHSNLKPVDFFHDIDRDAYW